MIANQWNGAISLRGGMRRILIMLLLLSGLATQTQASDASSVAVPQSGVDWSLTITKAATFEVLSSALETSFFIGFYGGTAATAAGIFIVSFSTSGAVYVLHEYVWERTLRPDADRTDPGLIAKKTATYRVVSTLRSFAIGSVWGGAEAATSAAFALPLHLPTAVSMP